MLGNKTIQPTLKELDHFGPLMYIYGIEQIGILISKTTSSWSHNISKEILKICDDVAMFVNGVLTINQCIDELKPIPIRGVLSQI